MESRPSPPLSPPPSSRKRLRIFGLPEANVLYARQIAVMMVHRRKNRFVRGNISHRPSSLPSVPHRISLVHFLYIPYPIPRSDSIVASTLFYKMYRKGKFLLMYLISWDRSYFVPSLHIVTSKTIILSAIEYFTEYFCNFPNFLFEIIIIKKLSRYIFMI